MTTTRTATTVVVPPRTVCSRAAAVLVLVSAALHLTMLGTGGLGGLAMAAMALACLPCARHLWRGPTRSMWGLVVLVDLGMLALHLQLTAGHPMGHATGHAMGAAQLAGSTSMALHQWSVPGVVAAQLVLAAVALAVPPARRNRAAGAA